MAKVVGIQFNGAGRIYYFDPIHLEFNVGEYAIVETVRGLEIGKVIIANTTLDDEKLEAALKPVIRKASKKDIDQNEKNKVMSEKAFEIFKKNVRKCNLDMKPLYAEYTIDCSKIVFYYTADDRVDFRELLKSLAPEFRARVELRQIGPREAARYLGGIGSCGMEVCCKRHLRDFDIVTMKMAKDQNLSLNVQKISGVCGKLLCCIAYENERYQEIKKEMPQVGSIVKTPNDVEAKIISVDYIQKTVRVQETPDSLPTTLKVSDISVVKTKEQLKNGK